MTVAHLSRRPIDVPGLTAQVEETVAQLGIEAPAARHA